MATFITTWNPLYQVSIISDYNGFSLLNWINILLSNEIFFYNFFIFFVIFYYLNKFKKNINFKSKKNR